MQQEKSFIKEMYEEVAIKEIGKEAAAYVKMLRLFGVTGFFELRMYTKVKNYLLACGIVPRFNEGKLLIWVDEVGPSLDRLFSGYGFSKSLKLSPNKQLR